MNRNWLRIAHRGASGSAPEHSRAAFERAVALGVDMIELDVQLTRDNELVVLHDLELGRTANATGQVRDFDLAALRELDFGSWFAAEFAGAGVLTLSEVLLIVRGKARLNVEIKSPANDWSALADRLAATLDAHNAIGSTIVSCFEPEALAALRAVDARVPLGLLWHSPDVADAWMWARQLDAVSLHPFWMLVSPDLVAQARSHGLKVLTWTVNEPEIMRSMLAAGVDGIISDHPERFSDLS